VTEAASSGTTARCRETATRAVRQTVTVLNQIIPRQGGRAGPPASELVAKLLDAFPYRAVFPCLYSVKSDKRLIDETPTEQRKRYRIERAKIHNVVQKCRHTKIILEARKVIRGVNQLTLPLSQYCFLAMSQMLLQIASADVARRFIRSSMPAVRHRIERANSPFDEMVKTE
jgi:hypothetical protein